MSREIKEVAPSRTESRTPNRTERIPFGRMRQKGNLDAATEKDIKSRGLVPVWVNDTEEGENIKAHLASGYRFYIPDGNTRVGDDPLVALTDKDKAIRRLANRVGADNRPTFRHLMVIPVEFWNEDHGSKDSPTGVEADNIKVDLAIRGGNPPAKVGGAPPLPNPVHGSVYLKGVDYKP